MGQRFNKYNFVSCFLYAVGRYIHVHMYGMCVRVYTVVVNDSRTILVLS